MAIPEQPTQDEMTQELNRRFEAGSREVAAGSGTGLVWDRDDYIGLDTLLTEWFGEEWFDEIEYVDDMLDVLGSPDGEALLSQMVESSGPPSWYWTIEAFQIGNRGYIFGNLDDLEFEPRFPIFAAWEPYDDDSALFDTLKAAFERHYEIIGAGNRINADGRLGRDGLQKLAAAVISVSDGYRFRVEAMIEQEDSGRSPEDLAATWIEECWQESL